MSPLPQNRGPRHNLDCAVLNYGLSKFEKELGVTFDSVRGMFQEGSAAFPGSEIREKSHVQVAVRNPACIFGCFKPQRPV